MAAPWRGSRAALLTAVVARICDSVILSLPAFLLDAVVRAFRGRRLYGAGHVGIWLLAPAVRGARSKVAWRRYGPWARTSGQRSFHVHDLASPPPMVVLNWVLAQSAQPQ